MDWMDDLPQVTGIDLVVALMAQKLMDGPVTFRSPFWDGDVIIETLNDYRSWIYIVTKIYDEPGMEEKALEIWETNN